MLGTQKFVCKYAEVCTGTFIVVISFTYRLPTKGLHRNFLTKIGLQNKKVLEVLHKTTAGSFYSFPNSFFCVWELNNFSLFHFILSLLNILSLEQNR